MSKYRSESLFSSQQDDQESPCGHIIRVAFEAGVDSEFDYAVPDKLWPVQVGQRVEVPFGVKNKLHKGFCAQTDLPAEQSFTAGGKGRRLKAVTAVVDKEPLLDASLMELARWISSYYICPLGQVIAAMVPSAVKKGIGVKKVKYLYLASQYEEIADQIKGAKQKQVISFLAGEKAFDVESAVSLEIILHEIGCTAAPITTLAEKALVKITQKTVFKSLPAIPDSMTLKTGKIDLNQDQQNAIEHIKRRLDTAQFDVTLIHGVTDSGKTEVYIRAIQACLEKNRSAIVLLPEIALTAQTVQRFNDRFENIAVMHSGLSAAQRNVQWQKIRAGQADVVIGARSAVFAPLPNLGIIVVDEEHEPGYKQDTSPRYNARDVAIKRCQLANGLCLLGSATPSLETLHNCRHKQHFSLVKLPKRVMDLPMPEMKLVDLRQDLSIKQGVDLISGQLAKYLHQALLKKEQAILLLNRRGYSNFI
ncbi:MAG: primosomal protein N', partial [Candidatus Brocadiia bacterium]